MVHEWRVPGEDERTVVTPIGLLLVRHLTSSLGGATSEGLWKVRRVQQSE